MSQSNPNDGGIKLPARVIVSLRAGAILAVANIICVLIFSSTWTHVKAEPVTVTTFGSAKKQIDSDLIVWTCSVSASNPDLRQAYATLKDSTAKVLAYLSAHGIEPTEMEVESIATTRHYVRDAKGANTDKITNYELAQQVKITSGRVGKVTEVARTITELIQDNVLLDSNAPDYIYTKLGDLKIEMLAAATQDARVRARQIASNGGGQLGQIIDAKMGVMQITPLHSNDVSDEGVNDTTSLNKEITATVSARFAIE
jgi:hypothetical protein